VAGFAAAVVVAVDEKDWYPLPPPPLLVVVVPFELRTSAAFTAIHASCPVRAKLNDVLTKIIPWDNHSYLMQLQPAPNLSIY